MRRSSAGMWPATSRTVAGICEVTPRLAQHPAQLHPRGRVHGFTGAVIAAWLAAWRERGFPRCGPANVVAASRESAGIFSRFHSSIGSARALTRRGYGKTQTPVPVCRRTVFLLRQNRRWDSPRITQMTRMKKVGSADARKEIPPTGEHPIRTKPPPIRAYPCHPWFPFPASGQERHAAGFSRISRAAGRRGIGVLRRSAPIRILPLASCGQRASPALLQFSQI
jgi:hypothetical protein